MNKGHSVASRMQNLVFHLAMNMCFPVFPDVADELDLSPG